jgi:sec-independent protein translocase protein TatA
LRESQPLFFDTLLISETGVGFKRLDKIMNIMFAWGLGAWEVVVIVAAALIFFGGKKIPELMRGLGTGIKEFKKATKEVTDEIQNAAEDKPVEKSISNGQSPPKQTVSQSANPPKA